MGFSVSCGRMIPLVLLQAALLSAQTDLNLSFENATGGAPTAWYLNSNSFQYTLDASTAVDGAQSLRMTSLTGDVTQWGYAGETLSASPAVGKTFHLSGYIRTQGVDGYAGLWVNAGEYAFKNLGALAPTGTTGWQRYDIYIDIPAPATVINFGVLLSGTGTAWFDGLSIDVNGTNPYLPSGPPTAEQIQWIRDHAIPFASLDPSADMAELQPLKNVIGNARIVGLGEGTHGTSEFFRMKSRLVSFLAQEMGFTIFAIEANMPESYRLNEYVLTGRGDPRELLKGMYFWTWNTQEVLDMVEWMRQFNASGRGRVQFLGFDMQYADVAMEYVIRFVRQADPNLLSSVTSTYSSIAAALGNASAAQDIVNQLQANRDRYLQTMPAGEVDWAIQNARIVEQATELKSNSNGTFRDSSMAANIEWIAAQAPPGSRMVLWAHNYHISKQPGAMGAALAQFYGSDYVALGFAFHSGTYRASSNTGLGVFNAFDSYVGTAEYYFHQTGTPRQILDLRLASQSDPASSWLFSLLWFRSIGALRIDGAGEFYSTAQLNKEYDALIFFDQTTAAVGLPFDTPMSPAVFAPATVPDGTFGAPYARAPQPGSGTPSSLPNAIVNVPYTQTLMGDGGYWSGGSSPSAWPYRNWTVTAGSLPAGLTLSSDGVLSGIPAQAGSFTFTVQTRGGSGLSAQGQLQLTISAGPPPGLRFVPLTPCRAVDTRGSGGPLASSSARSFAITRSGCPIPLNAQAYALNVTVVPSGPLPYLTLWPTGNPQPGVSTLNSWKGEVVANAAIVPAGTDGAISVFAAGTTDVILDVNGYFESALSSNAYSFYPLTPCRVADTRNPEGPLGGPMMEGPVSRDLPVPTSSCSVPFSAGAYSLNVTAVPDPVARFLGYLTTWPTGWTRPGVSTLNSWSGKVVANAALVPAGANGSISVFVTDPTDVILDTNGYFAPLGNAGALSFYPVAPCRVADTRGSDGPFGGPIVTASSTRPFAIPASGCGIPWSAAAYSLNVTVVPEGPLSYLTMWPAGSTQPGVSTLNSWDGTVVANGAIVPAGTAGAVNVFATSRTHVILDVNGYFAP